MEKHILSGADIERIVDAPTPGEALRLIGAASEYDFAQLKFPEQYEQVLGPAQQAVFERCYQMSPEALPVDIVACRYLFHNLRAALKARLAGADDTGVYSPLSVRDFSAEALRAAILGEGALPDYLRAATEAAAEGYARAQNPQAIDVAVDKAQLARQLALAKELGSELILDYVKRSIDAYNLLATLRAKAMGRSQVFLEDILCEGGGEPRDYFLSLFPRSYAAMASALFYRPYGKIAQRGIEAAERSGNFSALERLLDNALIEQVRLAKRVAFGPETLFGYLLAKENELRQIRIIMAAKINGIGPEGLRERLRENYV